MEARTLIVSTIDETNACAVELTKWLGAGSLVLFEGELGAGKSTFIRGIVRALGYDGTVRSPSYNLVQFFPTEPPILHADLYRVLNWEGLGIEEYLSTHICLIEWAVEKVPLQVAKTAWIVTITVTGSKREIVISEPELR